jgi:hypothetical protein
MEAFPLFISGFNNISQTDAISFLRFIETLAFIVNDKIDFFIRAAQGNMHLRSPTETGFSSVPFSNSEARLQAIALSKNEVS